MNKNKVTISKVLGMLDDDNMIQFLEEDLLYTANDVSFFKAVSDDDKLAPVYHKVYIEVGRSISRLDFDELKAAKGASPLHLLLDVASGGKRLLCSEKGRTSANTS